MITILVGAPRSGKTTLVNTEYLSKPNTAVVCGDDIRKALTGDRFNEYAEGFVSAVKQTMIRALHSRGVNVVVDGTHSQASSISKILDIDPEAEIRFVPSASWYVDRINMFELYKRAENTNQSDLLPIIERIFGQIMKLVHTVSLEDLRKQARERQMRKI